MKTTVEFIREIRVFYTKLALNSRFMANSMRAKGLEESFKMWKGFQKENMRVAEAMKTYFIHRAEYYDRFNSIEALRQAIREMAVNA